LTAVSLSGKKREIYSLGVRIYDIARDGRVLLDTGETRASIVALPPGATQERDLSWFDSSVAADLSADGRDLLFGDSGSGDAGSIYLRRVDGSEPKKLGEGKPLALSPNRKWALSVQRAAAGQQLVLLPTGAGEQRILPSGDAVLLYFGSWFPDSRRILFAASEKGGRGRSYVQDIDGGPPRPILRDGLLATLISPDGRSIAATSAEGGAFVCELDGKEDKPIEGVLADDDLIQWSGDGGSLFVRSAEKETINLLRVELKTGKRQPWKTLTPPDRPSFLEFGSGPRGVRLTPDGRSYVYTCWTRLTSLGLVEGLR